MFLLAQDPVDLPPQHALFSLQALAVLQGAGHGIVLAGKAAYEEIVFRDALHGNLRDIRIHMMRRTETKRNPPTPANSSATRITKGALRLDIAGRT